MREYSKTIFAAAIAVMLAAAPALAAKDAGPDKPPAKRHAEIDRFEKDGGTVVYLGRKLGLDGWILARGDDQRYAYTTEEGGIILGVLMDADGKLVTGDQVMEYQEQLKTLTATGAAPAPEPQMTRAPEAVKKPAEKKPEKPPATKVERLFAAVEKSNWVKAGDDDAPPLYIFINVNCDHCQSYWKDLDNAVKEGLVQVRLIPYGKEPANREGGAALLSVDEPARAWGIYMSGGKGALGKDKIKGDAQKKLDANTALVNEWKLKGPPFSLYRRTTDDEIIALVGRPKNPMVVLADLMKK